MPKKPTAKSASKKPVAKKTAAKNTKTAATKTAAAKKPAAKKATPAKKSATKKPTTQKASVKKRTATSPVTLLLPDATPIITSPSAGSVTASTDLTVTVTTDRDDLPYTLILTDITGRPTLVSTIPISAPNTSPFQVTIPGSALASGRTFKIRIMVDPSAGTTPPHNIFEVTITT